MYFVRHVIPKKPQIIGFAGLICCLLFTISASAQNIETGELEVSVVFNNEPVLATGTTCNLYGVIDDSIQIWDLHYLKNML